MLHVLPIYEYYLFLFTQVYLLFDKVDLSGILFIDG